MLLVAGYGLVVSSCLTIGQIERNCDKFARLCAPVTVTEYRDTTFYLKDTVYWQLPNDTVKITDTVRIVDNFCQLPTIYRRFGIVNVSAGVNNSLMRVNAWLTDSTVLIQHTDTIFIPNATAVTTNTITTPQKYIPGFYQFTFWGFIVVSSLVVLFLAYKLFFFRLQQLINKH